MTAIAAVVLYITKNAPAFKKIITLNPLDVIPFVLLQIALLAANGYALLIYLKIFRSGTSFFDSFGLSVINAFFNNIFVKGGPVIKGYYLKKIHNLSYTDFILTLASFTLIELMVGGFLGILSLFFIYLSKGCLNVYLLLFFIAVLLACCIIIKFPFHNIFKNRNIWVIRKLSDISVSWQKISANKVVMAQLFILALLNFIIFALRLQYGFRILYGNISISDCLLISTVGTLANLFAITPGSLGVREFLVGASYKLINGDLLQAVVVTILDRAVAVTTIFLLGGFFIIYFLKKTKKTAI